MAYASTHIPFLALAPALPFPRPSQSPPIFPVSCCRPCQSSPTTTFDRDPRRPSRHHGTANRLRKHWTTRKTPYIKTSTRRRKPRLAAKRTTTRKSRSLCPSIMVACITPPRAFHCRHTHRLRSLASSNLAKIFPLGMVFRDYTSYHPGTAHRTNAFGSIQTPPAHYFRFGRVLSSSLPRLRVLRPPAPCLPVLRPRVPSLPLSKLSSHGPKSSSSLPLPKSSSHRPRRASLPPPWPWSHRPRRARGSSRS